MFKYYSSNYIHVLWAVSDYLNTVGFLPSESQNLCQLECSWEWQQVDSVECFPGFLSLFPDLIACISLYLIRTSLVCNYAHCLSFFCHAQLRRTCLCPLENFLGVTGCFLPTPPRALPVPGWARAGSSWHPVDTPIPCGLGDPVLHFIHVCLHWAAKPAHGALAMVWGVQSWGGQSLTLPFLQPWRLLPFLGVRAPCWLSLSWLSVQQNSQCIFSSTVGIQSLPSLYHCKGLVPPRYAVAFAFAEFYVSPVSPVCLDPSEWGLPSVNFPNSLSSLELYYFLLFPFILRTAQLLLINNIFFWRLPPYN